MAADLQPLIDKVTKTKGVLNSVKVYLEGEPARHQAAIDAALANGATAEQLKPLQDLVDSLGTDQDAILAAIAANP